MSSGEARRVLIARALVHNPRALLFDEPCNSLDLAAQQSVRQTMRALANSGIGIVLVTHELGDIIPEIERVVLMSRGHIVADGPKEKILQNGATGVCVWSSSGDRAARWFLPDVVRAGPFNP
jgi:iron complex transport system ATP-binding protein